MKVTRMLVGTAVIASTAFLGSRWCGNRLLPVSNHARDGVGQRRRLAPDLEIGDRVCRPDHGRWPNDCPRIVVIVGSASCPVCTANKPVEERLYERCRALGIPVFYVLPDRPDQGRRSHELSSLGRQVLRGSLRSLGVARVPSVLAIDAQGTIQALWTGSLPSGQRGNAVVREITAGKGKRLYDRVPRKSIETLPDDSAPYQILSFRQPDVPPSIRAHYKVIPPSEVAVRARYELKMDIPTFVDCDTAPSPFFCQDILITLAKEGFSRLAAVDLPRRDASDGCLSGSSYRVSSSALREDRP